MDRARQLTLGEPRVLKTGISFPICPEGAVVRAANAEGQMRKWDGSPGHRLDASIRAIAHHRVFNPKTKTMFGLKDEKPLLILLLVLVFAIILLVFFRVGYRVRRRVNRAKPPIASNSELAGSGTGAATRLTMFEPPVPLLEMVTEVASVGYSHTE